MCFSVLFVIRLVLIMVRVSNHPLI
jgi:hypothetical protein